MVRLKVLAFFAVLTLTLGTIEASEVLERTVYAEKDADVIFGVNESQNVTVESCLVTTNKEEYFEIFKSSGRSNNTAHLHSPVKKQCQIKVVNAKEDDGGVWKIKANIFTEEYLEYQKSKESKRRKQWRSRQVTEFTGDKTYSKYYVYNVKVVENLKVITAAPIRKIDVLSNKLVTIFLPDDVHNKTRSCKLLDNQEVERELDEKCRLRMKVDKTHSGTWHLIANTTDNMTYLAKVDIIVKEEIKSELQQKSVYMERGSNSKIVAGKDRAVSCQWEDPHGVKYPLKIGECVHEMKPVTEYHNGVWKAQYSIIATEELIEETIIVQTYSVNPLNSTMLQAENGDINLLCTVSTEEMAFCSFIRPDGIRMNMIPGVGTEKYEYYGFQVQEHWGGVNQDCGITIHNVTENDYGVWKCLIGKKDRSEKTVVGSIFRVGDPKSFDLNDTRIQGYDVYVKKNNSYTIKCSVEDVLSYCWLRSPNGTVYSVSETGRGLSSTSLKYAGPGLTLGVCEVQIPRAHVTDSGKWTCHMGTRSGSEVDASLNVVVTDSLVTSFADKIQVDERVPTKLTCQTLPGAQDAIKSCRWITPTGLGINRADNGTYVTKTLPTRCTMTIEVVGDNDVGNWYCYVRLDGLYDEEFFSIAVSLPIRKISNFLLNSLAITVIVAIITVLIMFSIYKLKARRMSTKDIFDEKNDGLPAYPGLKPASNWTPSWANFGCTFKNN